MGLQIQQGEALALGITIDMDNEVVLVITIAVDENTAWAVSVGPEVARHFGRSIRDMSREAELLQDELDDLDPEEIADRLHAIRQRFTDPTPPV